MDLQPNFTVKKRDHFGTTTTAAAGSGVRKTVRVVGGGDRRPNDAPQLLTLYHFYSGSAGFWMPTMPAATFPGNFCRVALLETTLADALRLTMDDERDWTKDPAVRDTWTWTFYRQEPTGKRATLVGDVVLEENGDAWRVESQGVSFFGSFPDFAAGRSPQ